MLWLPWALLLSAGAAVLGVRAFRRGDRLGALSWAGWTLVPPALLLTGTLRLIGRIATAVLAWSTGLVFTPTTWLGLVLAGGAVALFGTARALRRRSPGRRTGTRDEPTPASLRTRPEEPGRRAGRKEAAGDDDLSEVEEILRRRGIG